MFDILVYEREAYVDVKALNKGVVAWLSGEYRYHWHRYICDIASELNISNSRTIYDIEIHFLST